jgi:hypothetical protein
MTERIFPPNAKNIWLREELHCADDLLSYAPGLRAEFLAHHTDWIQGDYKKRIPYVAESVKNIGTWNVDPIKYILEEQNVEEKFYEEQDTKINYPTACAMLAKYGDHCKMASYSSFEPNTTVERHTDLEHVNNKRIRIHIPLIIPEGDIYMEIEGIELDWSDICGVAGNYIHSAHNYSNSRRLIFILDLTKEFLNIQEDPAPDQDRYHYPQFIRGEFPKLLHTCQKK